MKEICFNFNGNMSRQFYVRHNLIKLIRIMKMHLEKINEEKMTDNESLSNTTFSFMTTAPNIVLNTTNMQPTSTTSMTIAQTMTALTTKSSEIGFLLISDEIIFVMLIIVLLFGFISLDSISCLKSRPKKDKTITKLVILI